MKRRALAGAVLLLLAPTLAGCSGEDETPAAVDQELTSEQAITLAQTRFKLGAQGSFVARLQVGGPEDTGHLEAIVTVDTVQHQAWGTLNRGPRDLAVTSEVAFNPQAFAQADPTTHAWVSAPWPDGTSTTLPLLFALSSDRPENEQLMRQNGARYLGTRSVDGASLEVFALPTANGTQGTTRLLLDDSGSLKRLENPVVKVTIDVLDQPAEPRPKGVAPLLPSVTSPTS